MSTSCLECHLLWNPLINNPFRQRDSSLATKSTVQACSVKEINMHMGHEDYVPSNWSIINGFDVWSRMLINERVDNKKFTPKIHLMKLQSL